MDKKRQHSKPEINSGEVLVDRAGYISRDKRIKNLIKAGKRLNELRQLGAYDDDKGSDIDDVIFDPTRQKGFDMADASDILRGIRSRKKPEVKKVEDNKQKPNGEGKEDIKKAEQEKDPKQ